MAAVSARMMRGPRQAETTLPCALSMARSSGAKPPSGPMRIAHAPGRWFLNAVLIGGTSPPSSQNNIFRFRSSAITSSNGLFSVADEDAPTAQPSHSDQPKAEAHGGQLNLETETASVSAIDGLARSRDFLAKLIALLAVALVIGQVRLRTIRSRLIRLQTEIAKSRRRVGEGSVG